MRREALMVLSLAGHYQYCESDLGRLPGKVSMRQLLEKVRGAGALKREGKKD